MGESIVKPRILIVDDDIRVGAALKDLVERSFDCTVCFPRSIKAMQDTVLNEAFDSVLVDANLSNWTLPVRIFGKEIRDGIDFASAYCKFQQNSLIVIFGPTHLPFPAQVQYRIEKLSTCNVRTIQSPLPSDRQEIRRAIDILKPELRPQIEETQIIHKANPIFQPLGVYEGMPSEEKSLRQHLLYKSACNWLGKWVNFNLREAGDSSWTVVCGGNFQKDYYGELLNGRRCRPDVKVRNRYPPRSELQMLAEAERAEPFLFWNTRDTKTVAKQFVEDRLEKIPRAYQDTFGIAVSPSCAKAYQEGLEDDAIDWCRRLSPFGQLRATKTIFRSLNGNRSRSVKDFARHCMKAYLNRVIEIYSARVEKVLESENTAVVELINLTADDNFSAPFDLAKLRSHGVKEVGQKFEYTVFADVRDRGFGEIELTE
jgi:hypothetical protein